MSPTELTLTFDFSVIAHKDASPSPFTAPVPAGSEVTFHWHHTGVCEGTEDNAENGWDCSHHGWTATYLASCPADCKDVDKTTLDFFKIHETALIDYREGRWSKGTAGERTGYWGSDAIFYSNNNTQSVTIPANIPNGNYVLRTEVMSKHNNGKDDSQVVPSTQFWPQAFNSTLQSLSTHSGPHANTKQLRSLVERASRYPPG
jgi:cellulase